MIKNFPCGLCSDEVGDMMIQFSVTYVTSGITLDVLILMLNNMKNCAMEIPFPILFNKGLKTVLFGGSSKTLPKSFSKPFDKKTTEKLKTFHKVSQLFDQSENSVSCNYYNPYELNMKSKTRRLIYLTPQYFFCICPY